MGGWRHPRARATAISQVVPVPVQRKTALPCDISCALRCSCVFWPDSAAHPGFELRCGILAGSAVALRCAVATAWDSATGKRRWVGTFFVSCVAAACFRRAAQRTRFRAARARFFGGFVAPKSHFVQIGISCGEQQMLRFFYCRFRTTALATGCEGRPAQPTVPLAPGGGEATATGSCRGTTEAHKCAQSRTFFAHPPR